MEVCEKCGCEMRPVGDDYKGDVIWECGRQCYIEEFSACENAIEDSKTHEQRLAEYEYHDGKIPS